MDKMSLVEVQVDKILKFTELPESSSEEGDYKVLHEDHYEHKLHKVRLAACLADKRKDFLTVT